jgi:amino acid adenylation domain-containing protein
LTAKERAQWTLHRLAPERGICNIGMAVRVTGHLRWWPLQEALTHLLRRHPALRAVLLADGGVPRKVFLPLDAEFPLTTESATDDTLDEVLASLVAVPFDLDGQALVRGHLVLLSDACVVCMVMHHLVADYTSARILLRELVRLYDSFTESSEPPRDLAGPAPLHLEEEADPKMVRYWVEHLAGVDPESMAMSGARPIMGRPTFAGDRVKRVMSDEAHAALRRLTEHTRVTENIVLLAAFYILLARHGAGPDLVVGVPVNGRRRVPPDVVGFHASTLPVRVAVDDGLGFGEFVRRTSSAFLVGFEHAMASFEAVAASLATRSGDWRVPLFRHMFNYRPGADGSGITLAGEQASVIDVYPSMSRLDLEWVVWPSETGVNIAAGFSTEVHDREFVSALLERYDAILLDLAVAPDRPLAEISGCSRADKRRASARNATTRRFPARSLLAEVRGRALATPGAPAVRAGGVARTYGELAGTAELTRQALAAHGVAAGDTVALYADRSPALAAAVVGVWAAGACYLPLDPGHPPSRVAYQVADAGVRCVLADRSPDPTCMAGRPWLPIEPAGAWHAPGTPERVRWLDPSERQVAYVLYTSGSTGQPKGVEVSHGALGNLIRDFADRLGASAADRTLWLTTFSFDISGLEVLLPLVTGGTVVVASDNDRMDPARLLELITDEDVGIIQATPTGWRHIATELRDQLSGRRVLSGGEPLDAALASRLLDAGCRLFNVYGPTETTIWSTAVELYPPVTNPVPVGDPIANTAVYVLDPRGRPVPPGVPGQLCISGAGLAVGYRGRPELTAQQFVDDRVLGRYYRTGDIVRETEVGITFEGRLDRQVKIRGHRVELGEVEAALAGHPEVRSAAVVAERDGNGQVRLVAVLQPATAVTGAGLPERVHAQLSEQLPAGALPSRYVLMASLPETANGKLDVRALAEQVATSASPAELPVDATLRRLVLAWRETLGDERLGADANFFTSGGHSLLAAVLAARLTTELAEPVSFDVIFDAPSPLAFRSWLASREAAR